MVVLVAPFIARPVQSDAYGKKDEKHAREPQGCGGALVEVCGLEKAFGVLEGVHQPAELLVQARLRDNKLGVDLRDVDDRDVFDDRDVLRQVRL